MGSGQPTLRARLATALRGYPWDAVLFSMLLVVLIVVLGSYAVDAVWTARWNDLGQPVAGRFRGTCYWMGDARILVRIAGNGYSDYDVSLSFRHLTVLPDRSWWPLYVNLTALALRLTGGDYCAGWWVNLFAMALLPPVIQGITGTRRPLLMTGVALLPFGAWLYAAMAEGTFLLLSGVLLWLSLRSPAPSASAGLRLLWGALALLVGALVGLTKPNALALLPGFGLLALARAAGHLRASDGPPSLRRRLRLALADSNPGWTALLGALGILLGLGLWFHQTSGYYPLYVMMAQRTLWYKEFDAGSPLGFLAHLMGGWWAVLQGRGLPHPLPWNMMEFAALNLMAILIVRDLPPRWPAAPPRSPTPLYATASMLAVFGLMFLSGQAHAVERYFIGNIFFVVAYLRYVYGDEDQPPVAALPRLVRSGGPGAFPALLRLAVLACGLLLLLLETIVMVVHGI